MSELEHEGHHHCHEDGCCCGHHHGHEHDEDGQDLPKLIFAVILFVIAICINYMPFFGTIFPPAVVKGAALVLFFAAYLMSAWEVLHEAIENIRHGKVFGEAFLMSFATVGAILIGEYAEAVIVMILYNCGELLEDKALDHSKHSIMKLMDIRPDMANVKRNAGVESVRAETVRVGEHIIVRPGERVPLDGIVVSGSSFVDTSAFTGESVPREVKEDDSVLSGFVNTSAVLEIKVMKDFGESSVSRVLELVEEAQEKKARAEKFISRFARVYTPWVCFAALAIAIVPPIIMGGGRAVWYSWLYRALEVLVVSCPCALVISVPLSFFAGIGLESRKGVLVKGSNYIEMLAEMHTAVFDKTGTLTQGVFEVSAVHLAEGSFLDKGNFLGAEDLLALVTHAEYYSNHPISRSLKKAHRCPLCETVSVAGAEEISGHGIRCVIDGKRIVAGNMRLLEQERVTGFAPCEDDAGGTVVHVAVDGVYMGHIVISDREKDDARSAITSLKDVGVSQIVMLTGDTAEVAEAMAERLGVDKVYANLLPQQKVEKIEEILAENISTKKRVAFVGDGINDAPVLSRSDVGIAMGALGSDAAIEAADVVIMDDMPSKLAVAVKAAKKTMVNVWENVCFALGMKTAIMILCILGVTNMWFAVFGDVGVTLLAVLNAMRLLAGGKMSGKIESRNI